ncbi:MAG: hypothetical protein KBA61_04805 [Spirochaetes bacterium]|nr:hypothetical protein [Spirochaetota bacterium]
MNRKSTPFLPLLVMVAALLSLTRPASPWENRKNVLEYYNMLPQKYFSNSFAPDSRKYALRRSGGKWITRSSADYDFAAIVDTGNGYIRIEDHGTGGGGRTDEVVLYRDAREGVYLCISQVFNPGVWDRNFVRVLSCRDGSFSDVTEKILPSITLADFLREKHDRALTERFTDTISSHPMFPKNEASKITHFTYSFPRYGTTAKVSVNFTRKDNLLFLFYGGGREAARDTIRRFLDTQLKYSSVDLTWNRESARFETGKKQLWDGK